MMKIAVVITCYNRKEKTIRCLQCLYHSLYLFEKKNGANISLCVYITDDGSTDGTFEAIRKDFSDKNIKIIRGNGNLFWAGGMRVAWKAAMEERADWDFYLMLNDDTMMFDNCFEGLFATHQYALDYYGRSGIYSGITKYVGKDSRISYGGAVWTNRLLAKSEMLKPTGTPQLCDMTNANILLIHRDVVDAQGIFYDEFQHATADYDYSIHARKKGIPVLVTGEACGECDNDHGSAESRKEKVCGMSLQERRSYFRHPLHSNKDYLLFIKRNAPLRYPLVTFGRFLNIYMPRLYYKLFQR